MKELITKEILRGKFIKRFYMRVNDDGSINQGVWSVGTRPLR